MIKENESYRVKFGRRLQDARKRLGVNQTDFSALIGVSKNTLSRYERGELSPPTDTLAAIALQLAEVVDTNWLVLGARKDPDHPQVIRVGSMGRFWGLKEGERGDHISVSLRVDDVVTVIESCARFGNLKEGDYSNISRCIETLVDWVRRAKPEHQVHFFIPVFKGVFENFPTFPFRLPRREDDTETPPDLPPSET